MIEQSTATSEELFERAKAVIPGGVNSPVRAFKAVGGTPRFIASAKGAWLTDEDGNQLVDLVGSWGPMLLGHAHPEVIAAAAQAAANGTSFGTPTRNETELAELIVARTPIEQVRLVNSGTEATMSVIRLARAFTGRSIIIKFAGCYHGHVDSLLASAGSGLLTLSDAGAVPSSPGVTASSAAETIVVEYNDREAIEQVFATHPDKIAAIITEAAPGNMGCIEPGIAPDPDGQPEHFNAFLKRIANHNGALFISDEVMTGFRVSAQGQYGRDHVVPDLMTFGKVMGGGFPAAAFGGRKDIMSELSPLGAVYQAGTLSGNPVASAAGATTLRLATQEVYDHLEAAADQLRAALRETLTEAGVRHTINSAGSMFSVFMAAGEVGDRFPVTSYTQASGLSAAAYAAYFNTMLNAGVYLPPSAYECWFLSSAHDDVALARIVDAMPAAAAAARAALDAEGNQQS